MGLQGKLLLGYPWQGHLPHVPVPTLVLTPCAFQQCVQEPALQGNSQVMRGQQCGSSVLTGQPGACACLPSRNPGQDAFCTGHTHTHPHTLSATHSHKPTHNHTHSYTTTHNYTHALHTTTHTEPHTLIHSHTHDHMTTHTHTQPYAHNCTHTQPQYISTHTTTTTHTHSHNQPIHNHTFTHNHMYITAHTHEQPYTQNCTVTHHSGLSFRHTPGMDFGQEPSTVQKHCVSYLSAPATQVTPQEQLPSSNKLERTLTQSLQRLCSVLQESPSPATRWWSCCRAGRPHLILCGYLNNEQSGRFHCSGLQSILLAAGISFQ